MRKIIITGGCGFIGSALVKRLNTENVSPLVIDIRPPSRSMRDLKFRYKNIDLRKKNVGISRLFKMTNLTVVHLAAEHFIPRCEQYPQRCFETNVYGTHHIVDLIKENRRAMLIFPSTGDVYPSSAENLIESSISQPGGVYSETKRIGENIVRSYLPGRHKIFRIFNIYGPGDETPHLIPSIIRQLKRGHRVRLGNLRTIRDYIFIDDIVTVMTRELTEERHGLVYNVGTGMGTSAEQIMAIFEKLLGYRIHVASTREMRRVVDKPRLVSNPTKVQRDYGISHFITLEQGLSLLIRNAKI